jgi:transaldolase
VLLLLVLLQVMKQMAMHPLTDKGLQGFVDDWEKAKAQQKNAL